MTLRSNKDQNSNFADWIDHSEAKSRIEQAGLPHPRSEPWKYTNPQSILEVFESGFHGTAQAPICESRSVEIHSFHSQESAEIARDCIGKIDKFATSTLPAMNLLHLQSGFVIRASKNGGSHVVHIHGAPNVCERFFVLVEAGATLELVETCTGGNRVFECVLEDEASLTHQRLQHTTDSVEYSSIATELGALASYRLIQYSRGARLRRNDISISVNGEGAESELLGGWRLEGNTHLDSQIAINHIAENTKSRQKFHGVVGGQSRAIFNGRIHIAETAQWTDAHLNNKNVMTSDEAQVYAKPELEIYANDVVCSHGATSGQLDESQIFYLRSRGISDDASRELLVDGFLDEIVERDDGAKLLGIRNEIE